MSKLNDLHILVRLLKEFELPVSPILEYAIKEKEEELSTDKAIVVNDVDFISEGPIQNIGSFSSIQEEFASYLFNTKSERTAQNYIRYIDKPLRAHINKVIDSNADSIYAFRTASEVQTLVAKLKEYAPFMNDNLRWHNALTAAISSYLKFIKSRGKLKCQKKCRV